MKFCNIINDLLADTIHIKVFKILRLHSEGLTGRALGTLAKTSVFKINGVLKSLVAQGVITQVVMGRAHLYRLNEHHILVRDIISYLIDYENNLLNQLGQAIIKKLSFPPLSIIVYGSIARGDENPSSDIDLLLIYTDKVKLEALSQTGAMIEWINRNYGNMATIRQMKISEFQKPKAEHKILIRNIIKEGKNIGGLSITEILSYHDNKN